MSDMKSFGVVGLRRFSKEGGTLQVSIPASIARALNERGLNEAEVFITDDGILLKPRHNDSVPDRRRSEIVTLPESWEG